MAILLERKLKKENSSCIFDLCWQILPASVGSHFIPIQGVPNWKLKLKLKLA
jgi:hypothetical protein